MFRHETWKMCSGKFIITLVKISATNFQRQNFLVLRRKMCSKGMQNCVFVMLVNVWLPDKLVDGEALEFSQINSLQLVFSFQLYIVYQYCVE